LAGWATVLLALLTAQFSCGKFTRRIVAAASALDDDELQQDVLGFVPNGRGHNL